MKWFCAFLIFFSSVLPAHEGRPLHIEIVEKRKNVFDLKWKIPPSIPHFNSPSVKLKGCAARGEMVIGGGLIGKQVYDCGESLPSLLIDYPIFNPAVSTLIRLRRVSGARHTKLLGPEDTLWKIPLEENTWSVAENYTKLGISHILKGIDHLLFLVCLLLIAGTRKRILITVTGFTLAHSITLALSALEIVKVPIAPVEAVIALSIVFLAHEIVKDRRDTLTWKYPITVSSSFGLLHGFGFAAVLGEIGLPQTEIVAGLLFFNIGVEIGQIVFVLAVTSLIKGLMMVNLDIKRSMLKKPFAYAIGILATYWMIERTVGFI